MRYLIVRSNRQITLPKRDAVKPVGCLFPRTNRECNDDTDRDRTKNNAPVIPILGQIGDRPGDGDSYADVRKVGETISPGLQARLKKTEHRKKEYQIPEPADKKIRPLPDQQNRNQGDRQDQRRGS